MPDNRGSTVQYMYVFVCEGYLNVPFFVQGILNMYTSNMPLKAYGRISVLVSHFISVCVPHSKCMCPNVCLRA